MEAVKAFLDIGNTAFSLWGYDVSWLELLGTAFGLWCVWLVARDDWKNWPIGIVNIVLFFWLFWQIRLYSDMMLQVVFLVMSVVGWYKWVRPGAGEADADGLLRVSFNSRRANLGWFVAIGVGTVLWGLLIVRVNVWFPTVFPEPAAFPYWDALTTVGSVAAIWLQAKKRVESWYLWIACDIVDFVLYLSKGTLFLGLEYLVFIAICVVGLLGWLREWRSYPENGGVEAEAGGA